MEASSVQSVCALCHARRPLCDSHLLPKALYRLMRSSAYRNPNPVVTASNRMLHSSKQISQHLLCAECETRFTVNGEDWVLKRCHRGSGKFRLREQILAVQPKIFGKDGSVYHAADIPSVDVHKLAYFASSVFWRASCSWKFPHETAIPVPLGKKYAEDFRQYLLGKSAFPQNVSLMLSLSSLEKPLMYSEIPYGGRVAGSHHGYQFGIPGLVFTLAVGRMIPESTRVYCLIHGYGNPIVVSRLTDQAVWQRLLIATRGKDWATFHSRYGPPKPLTEL
jgi:hypothetical protein